MCEAICFPLPPKRHPLSKQKEKKTHFLTQTYLYTESTEGPGKRTETVHIDDCAGHPTTMLQTKKRMSTMASGVINDNAPRNGFAHKNIRHTSTGIYTHALSACPLKVNTNKVKQQHTMHTHRIPLNSRT